MGNFLDELERNKTVEIYKSFKFQYGERPKYKRHV